MFTQSMSMMFVAAITWAAPFNDETPLKSPALASELTTAMSEQKLDAVAAKDPMEPDRFVAALFYPGSQLLVLSARSNNTDVLETRLLYKQYRDIYLELQGQSLHGSTLFVQDMKADGLPSTSRQVADIVYRPDGSSQVFDADWQKHGTTEEQYRDRLLGADELYSRLLSLLLAQIRPT
jgi:hypothetical protein